MGLSDFVALGGLVYAVAFVGIGAAALRSAIRAERQRRAWAAYRAASLVVEAKRTLRAAQRRAFDREWGRAA